MTDLKSRADELIDRSHLDTSAASWDRMNSEDYTEATRPSRAALTRFVHALCEAADKLGKSRTWAQHHSNCAMLQVFGKCDCGLREFRPELEAALAALEKGEKG